MVPLDADALVAHDLSSSQGRSSSAKRIQHGAFSKRQHTPNELTHKALRLQAGVGRQPAFFLASRRRRNHVPKGSAGRGPTKAADAPTSKVVLNTALQGLPKNQPWLPHGTWHYAHATELLVSALGTVAAPHRHDQPSDFAAALQARARKSAGNDVGQQRIRRHHHVCARDENGQQQSSPLAKEIGDPVQVAPGQHRETWQGRSLRAVKRRRLAPHPAFPQTQLALFCVGVLHKSIGRVRYDGLHRAWRLSRQPLEAVGVMQDRLLVDVGAAQRRGCGSSVSSRIGDRIPHLARYPAMLPNRRVHEGKNTRPDVRGQAARPPSATAQLGAPVAGAGCPGVRPTAPGSILLARHVRAPLG